MLFDREGLGEAVIERRRRMGRMGSHRMQRGRELLKREIGEVIRREIPVNEAGLVTVNDVDVAGDLRVATVFIGILGNSEQQRTGLVLLQKNRSRIQSLVAKAVILKYRS